MATLTPEQAVEHYPSQVLFGEPPAHSRAVKR